MDGTYRDRVCRECGVPTFGHRCKDCYSHKGTSLAARRINTRHYRKVIINGNN